jgi:hypothetical protein
MRGLRLALLTLLLASCSNQMEPAKQQVDAAQTAVDSSAADASKYMPEHLKTLEGRLAKLKTTFDQKDYQTVVATGPSLVTDAKSLQQQAAEKKAEGDKQLAMQWAQLRGSVPQILDAIKARLGELQKAKHTPKGLNISEAQSALSDASASWDKATTAHTAGDVSAAVASATQAQQRAQAAADALKFKVPMSNVAPS